jgi:hypothetical protein
VVPKLSLYQPEQQHLGAVKTNNFASLSIPTKQVTESDAETSLGEFAPYFLFQIVGNCTLLLTVGRRSIAVMESAESLLQSVISSGSESLTP